MVYAFECKECGNKFEVNILLDHFDKWKKGEYDIQCSKCESKKIENIIGNLGVHLKGDGWTRTNF